MLYRTGQGQAGAGGQYVVMGNDPSAHMPGQLDPAQSAVGDAGDAMDPAGEQHLPSSIRSYRTPTPARGAAQDNGGGTFASDRPELAALHDRRGAPDPRHVELAPSGLPFGPDDPNADPIPSARTADDLPIELADEPPDRPRAGATGDRDPGRPARTRFFDFVLRPFDKLIAEHPGPIDRAYQAAPFAARPLQYAEPVPHALPSVAGAWPTLDGPGKLMAGPQLNTVRVLPQPWDAAALNDGGAVDVPDPGAYAVQQYARAGWRAR